MAASDSDQILRPRKRKWALVFLACLAFVAIGSFMLRDPKEADNRPVTYFFLGFFGLGCLVSLIQFVPGSSFLRLSPEGLDVRTMWRTKVYRWSDIERFGVAEFSTVHGLVVHRVDLRQAEVFAGHVGGILARLGFGQRHCLSSR